MVSYKKYFLTSLFLFLPNLCPQLEIINMVMQTLIHTSIEMTDTPCEVILNNVKWYSKIQSILSDLFLKVEYQTLWQAIDTVTYLIFNKICWNPKSLEQAAALVPHADPHILYIFVFLGIRLKLGLNHGFSHEDTYFTATPDFSYSVPGVSYLSQHDNQRSQTGLQSPAVWLGGPCITSLFFSFFICKMNLKNLTYLLGLLWG